MSGKMYVSRGGGIGKELAFAAEAQYDGYRFRCVVTDGEGGSETSKSATLTVVSEAGLIVKQPADVTAESGAEVKFSVEAEGEALTYQWECHAPGATTWVKSRATGATTAEVTFTANEWLDGYVYRCVITDGNGDSETSEIATLTVVSEAGLIVKQPEDVTAESGAEVKFRVEAEGETLTYQWQCHAPGATTWVNSGATGATTAEVTFTANEWLDGYVYRCVVTDGNGDIEISEIATLTVVSEAGLIVKQPASAAVTEGETACFSVETNGDGLSYQWQMRAPGSEEWVYCDFGGETAKVQRLYLVDSDGLTQKVQRAYVVDTDGLTKLVYRHSISITDAVVTLGTSLTYNASSQTQTVASVVVEGVTLTEGVDYTVSGNTATNAGIYSLTITGKGLYEGTVQAAWSIAKAAGSISVSRTNITMLGHVGMTQTATISYTGDGAITVESSNTGVVTASISGNTVTVKSVTTGSATVTITMADGTNYTGASCTIAVSNTVIGTLNSTSWGTIKTIAAAGTGENYWSVGDRKAVEINGTVGAYTFSNETYYCYILGFNHNQSIEGKGIHFQFGYTAASDGVNIAFCDSKYDQSSYTDGFRMNLDITNEGGWESSYMHETICPAFLNVLPSALQSVISTCTKYSDNTGGGSGDVASNVTSTSSKIWLPAEFEVQGTQTYANSAEQNYQKQYAYYANGNSKIKYKGNATSTACLWWLRSVNAHSFVGGQLTDSYFCRVAIVANNTVGTGDARYSNGFAPCFKVA